jgi:polyisoprenoid-binding protein YceI
MNAMTKWAVLLAACATTAAFAGWTSSGESTVSFNASGPAGFKIDGSCKKVDVKDDGTNLVFAINLNDVDTGMSLRNKHMLEDVEAEKQPNASLSVPLSALKLPDDGKSLEAEAKGTWTMHGQAKDITVKYKVVSKGGGAYEVEGEGPINTKDHGIKIRSYMGITVKPDMVIKANLKLKK